MTTICRTCLSVLTIVCLAIPLAGQAIAPAPLPAVPQPPPPVPTTSPATAPSTAPSTAPADELPAGAIKKLGGIVAGAPVDRVNGLAVTPDSRTILAACEDGRVIAWDFDSGKGRVLTYADWPATAPASAPTTTTSSAPAETSATAPSDTRRLIAIGVSADGKLVAASSTTSIHWWQLADGKYLGKVPAASARRVSFSPDAKQLRAIVGDDLLTWNLSDQAPAGKETVRKPVIMGGFMPPNVTIKTLDSDADSYGDYSATLWVMQGQPAYRRGLVVTVVETDTNRQATEVTISSNEKAASGAMAMSPNGRYVAVGSWNEKGRLASWDVATMMDCGDYKGHNVPVTAVRFTPDGKYLVSGDVEGIIYVWTVRKAPQGSVSFENCWSMLVMDQPNNTFRALIQLSEGGDDIVRSLGDHLRPKVETDMNEFKKIIAELDSDTFAVRKAAREKLAPKAQALWPLLQDTMAEASSTEVRNALETLLSTVERSTATQERFGVQALERINSDLSRETLRRLATLSEETQLGKLSRAAVAKMKAAPASQPASQPTTKP